MTLKATFNSKRALLMLAAAMFSSAVWAETSLWKISKGDDYLYLGGTVHFLPESALPLPAEFEKAYQATDTLVLETSLPDPADTAVQALMMQAMTYQDDRRLSTVLSAEVYLQLANYFAPYGLQLQQLDSFKPGFIVMQMLGIELMKANMAGDGVDAYFDKKAQADAKPRAYLETVDSQIQLLANMGEGYEDAFIRLNLQQFSDFDTYFEATLNAWRAGDMQTLNTLMVQPTRDMDPILYQALIVVRNQNWLPQIEQMFGNTQKELVLVGAGHLAGEHSVLALLEQAGYQVQQLILDEK